MGDTIALDHISQRGRDILGGQSLMSFKFDEVRKNTYHPTSNPKGIVNLGISENKTVDDLLKSKLSKKVEYNTQSTRYGFFPGRDEFLSVVASFLTKYFQSDREIRTDEVVGVVGVGAALNCLAHILCDPGDYVLVPSPYYRSFDTDFSDMAQAKMYAIDLTSKDTDEYCKMPFCLTVARLEQAYHNAVNEGKTVKAILICNPANPLGCFFTQDDIIGFLNFADRFGLHIIFDEIYFLSAHQPGKKPISVLSLTQSFPDSKRVHMVWGLSKDFALSGLRVGIAWTQDRAVYNTLVKLAYYHSIPPPIQDMTCNILGDQEWLDKTYLPAMRFRLYKSQIVVTKTLKKLNIPFIQPTAGLFIWANLQQYLEEKTLEAEAKLWLNLLYKGVYMMPGYAFGCAERGWFRIVFSDHDKIIAVGMTRFEKALGTKDTKVPMVRRKPAIQTTV